MRFGAFKILSVFFSCALISACNDTFNSVGPKHKRPVPPKIVKKMKTKGMRTTSPILLRIYKDEDVLEVWKENNNKKYALLESFEICKWSGKLGPKHKEGDRQAPEGFYHVTPGLMNPKSSYHLAFNTGYPNRFDRANGRTGSHLMVHGACSSAGCYSMTDENVEVIYALARDAFSGGQRSFQIQAMPFRMTPENMAKHVDHPEFEFWKMLKEGNDHFEITGRPPKVDYCEKRYVFNRTLEEDGKFNSREQCPPTQISQSLALAFNKKQNEDEKKFKQVFNQLKISPFVADKPKAVQASIKARPTIGQVTVIVPQQPVIVEQPSDPLLAANPNGTTVTDNGSIPVPIQSPNALSQPVLTQPAQQAQSADQVVNRNNVVRSIAVPQPSPLKTGF